MPRIKVDFIISKMSSGGAERVVANLANYLTQENYFVRIITFYGEDHYPLDSRIIRIRLHKKRITNKVLINGFINLFKFYSNKINRPDIVSSHIDMMGFITIPVCKIFKIKLIVSEHFNHYSQSNLLSRKILWNQLYRYPNAVTILTKFDLEFFSSRSDKVVVMENPCSFDKTNDSDSNRDNTILAIGNLNRYIHKGFDNLVKIASEVLPNNPEWKLKIIGPGHEGRKILDDMISEFNLGSQIGLLGFSDDIKSIMSSAKIFILSSRNEGLPMVLLEAMSQGMACISYDCISGPSDIIEHDVNGLLVKDQDKNAMTFELNRLINDEALQNRLMQNAPEALQKFSILEVGKKWQKLIEEILK